MSQPVRAATLIGPKKLEVREYPSPDLSGGGALLQVDTCGLCGTDYGQFSGHYKHPHFASSASELIPGHEVLGRIIDGHPETLRQWNISIGDRIALEPNVPCGSCSECVNGRYVSCTNPDGKVYGFVPADIQPALWGGYAETMFLTPGTIVHRVPDHADPRRVSLFNVLANGFQWACQLPDLQYGQSVLVLGAGQRGLACIAAARAAGAGQIITTGLPSDARRLEAARILGADLTIDVGETDVVDVVLAETRGRGVDIAVDCSAGATQPVLDGLRSIALGGTLVLGGIKHGKTLDGFPVDDVVHHRKRIIGALASGFTAYEQALAYLSDPNEKLSAFRTHEFPLDQAETALRVLGGEMPEEHPIYVSLAIGADD